MDRINAVVDGQLRAVPVLTEDHLVAMKKVSSGISPGCPPDILQDLIQAGLLADDSHGD